MECGIDSLEGEELSLFKFITKDADDKIFNRPLLLNFIFVLRLSQKPNIFFSSHIEYATRQIYGIGKIF